MRYERPAIERRVKATGPVITQSTAPTSNQIIATPTDPDTPAP